MWYQALWLQKKKKNLCDILAPVMFFNRKYLIFENITISSDGYLKIWISCGSKEFGFFTELYSHNSNEYRTQTSWKNGGILRIKNFPNYLEPRDIQILR